MLDRLHKAGRQDVIRLGDRFRLARNFSTIRLGIDGFNHQSEHYRSVETDLWILLAIAKSEVGVRPLPSTLNREGGNQSACFLRWKKFDSIRHIRQPFVESPLNAVLFQTRRILN